MTKKSVRTPLSPTQRLAVARKTGGKCHVCGGRLDTRWQADHVRSIYQGGECREDNFLPSCAHCNRMRWGYDPRTIRLIMRLGVYMWAEVKKQTALGKAVEVKYRSR